MIARAALPGLLAASAALLAAGCDRTPATIQPSQDDRAAQVAAERAAEQTVLDQATLARLSRDVAELHVEIDQMKASRQALNETVIDARLQALEVRAAQAQTESAPLATPTPTAAPVKATPPRRGAATKPATGQKDGGR